VAKQGALVGCRESNRQRVGALLVMPVVALLAEGDKIVGILVVNLVIRVSVSTVSWPPSERNCSLSAPVLVICRSLVPYTTETVSLSSPL
jgi:hypothetical protein